MPKFLRYRKTMVAVAAVLAVSAGATAAVAGTSAAGSSSPRPASAYSCEAPGHATVTLLSTPSSKCPAGTTSVVLGAQGPAGARGAPGAAGQQGPAGVVQASSISGDATVLTAIGGHWSAGHVVAKTFTLAKGTYLVTLSGDFFKEATTTATPVLQVQLNGGDRQLTAYTGAFPYSAAEATGLGSDGTPSGLEQTATAYGIVTMAASGTLEIDAFGYNPDRSGSGGGDFGVIARADIVAVTPAA